MNSTELKNLVFKRCKDFPLICDIEFQINYGPAHFFKFRLCDREEISVYFNLKEHIDNDLIKERIFRKIDMTRN